MTTACASFIVFY